MSTVLLKVLVGSHAHGLDTPASDRDYRGVFLSRTQDFLRIGGEKPKSNQWIEGEVDDTSYELGHFLDLATRSNPSILEVFKSPCIESSVAGDKLRSLFDEVWSSKAVYHAFTGYSHNQQVKLLSDKPEFASRKWKYAVAYLRVLLQAQELLSTGSFAVFIRPEWNATLRNVRAGVYTTGQVMDMAERIRDNVTKLYLSHPGKETNFDAINDFLLGVRKINW